MWGLGCRIIGCCRLLLADRVRGLWGRPSVPSSTSPSQRMAPWHKFPSVELWSHRERYAATQCALPYMDIVDDINPASP